MFHLELQSFYISGNEYFQNWLDGDRTPLRGKWQEFNEWLHAVVRYSDNGIQIERVRIIDEPPTDYQQWENWCVADNLEAGEKMWVVGRSVALKFGIDPGFGGLDWWLFDDSRLVLQSFDDNGGMDSWISTDLGAARQQWRSGRLHHQTEIA